MGRGDPLEDPELDAIDRCLDDLDLTGAQERLSAIGQRSEYADVAPYFVARLLFLRGKLDARGVAQRLREVLGRVAYFPKAALILHEAEAGVLERPSGLPPPSGGPPTSPVSRHPDRLTPEDASASRGAAWRPSRPPVERRSTEPLSRPQPAGLDEAERRLAPTEPRGPMAAVTGSPHSAQPLLKRNRSYTPVGGMDAVRVDSERTSRPPLSQYPDIPRGPRVPEFESNRAPPSYRPREVVPEFDALKQKSALPADAGRYSQRVNLQEDTREGRPRPEKGAGGPASTARGNRPRDPRREPSSYPPSTRARGARSERPRAPRTAPPGLPPLHELAALVDQAQFVRAIATINRAGVDIPEDYGLLRCRALAGAGYTDQAFEALGQLLASPALSAEVRAGAARLLVELGEPEKALIHAVEALRQDPEGRLSRLTYALAAVRCARRSPDDALLVKAERALETFRGRTGPHAALTLALEACVFAGLGEAERALETAQRALTLDGRSADALAATVEAHTATGREAEARQTWKRLVALAPDEAEVLKERNPDLALDAGDTVQATSYEPWDALEVALAGGARTRAIEAVEKLAEEYVARMSKSASQSGLTAMATVASTCLTRAPVLSAFAPFDLSLWSIERVEAALDALYGKEPRPRLRTDEGGLRLLVGSYAGEAIRLARGGRWEGRVAELQKAKVVVGEQYWYPFQAVSARIHSGGRSRLVDGLRGALALRGSPPWKSHIPNPVVPPTPWGTSPWPHPVDIARVGQSLMRSPISVFCEQSGHGPLDLSLPSLAGIDAFLELICPVGGPVHEDAVWTRRIAAYVGGYVGEVLRELVGGEWTDGAPESKSASDFVLVLKDRIEARPVERVLQRVTGQHYEATTDYVSALARRIARGAGPR